MFTEEQVRILIAEAVAPLLKRIAELEAEVARLKKDSSNSSKPPSSDIVKPKPKDPGGKGKGRRRVGGQPGHPKQEREMFPPEEVDDAYEYELTDHGDLEALDDWRVIQQVELVKKLYRVTEHRARRYRCPKTGRMVTALLPREVVQAGLVGPGLSALIAYQKGACHMSYGSIRTFLGDVLGIDLSTGQLAKVVHKASGSLAAAYQELRQVLSHQAHLGVDETGHKDRGQLHWTWCFRGDDITVFKIDPSRGCQVLVDTLGETFKGVMGCDYFSAYRKYKDHTTVTVQFCLAHLIRDVKFLTTLRDKATQRFGHKLLEPLRHLFHVLHRRDQMGPKCFARSLKRARDELLRIARCPPDRAEARTLADRFRKHGRSYFTFMDHDGVPPTNNATEQAIRFVVIDRKVTQGTRGDLGQRWCERIWTTLATCAQQHRSAFQFIADSIQAHFRSIPKPKLLPASL